MAPLPLPILFLVGVSFINLFFYQMRLRQIN
jgi:hypothetical protein